MTVLQLLQRIISLLQQLLAIAGVIQGATSKSAQENRPFEIDTATQELLAIGVDPTFGPQALRNTIDTNAALATAQYDDVVARLDQLQRADTAVTLPTTPPVGYGSSGSTAAEIWGYALGTGVEAGSYLVNAGEMPGQIAWMQVMWPSVFAPGWSYGGPWGYGLEAHPNTDALTMFDPSTIVATDVTVSGWLDRVYPGHGASYDSLGRPFIVQPSSDWTWTYFMGSVEFAEYQAAKNGAAGSAALVPPVWPGADFARVGIYVDIANGDGFVEPLDGVLVRVLAVPPGTREFDFVHMVSYGYIGSVSFATDGGEFEFPQSLGPSVAIYTPTTMVTAGAVRFRIKPGVAIQAAAFSIVR